jgi:RPA family protein
MAVTNQNTIKPDRGFKEMALSDNGDPEIEYSPLTTTVTRQGVTLHINIYRIAGDDTNPWSLEVVDEEGNSTVWEDTFKDDTDAFAEFVKTLEVEGIGSFSKRPPARFH